MRSLDAFGRGIRGFLYSAFLLALIAYTTIAFWGSLKSSCLGQLVGGAISAVFGEAEPPTKVRPIEVKRDNKLVLAFRRVIQAVGLQPEEAATIGVGIVQSDEWNAVSFGQRRFLFWEGMNTWEIRDLTAVVAHEFAHDELGHSDKMKNKGRLIGTVSNIVGTLLGHDAAGRAEVSGVAGDIILPSYSREQELEADLHAVKIMTQMGLSERAARARLVAALRKLKRRYGSTETGFFDSHPATDERIETLSRDR